MVQGLKLGGRGAEIERLTVDGSQLTVHGLERRTSIADRRQPTATPASRYHCRERAGKQETAMSESSGRTRVHPRERFAGHEKLFKLSDEFATLPKESSVHQGHMQKALYRHKAVTTAIFAFEAGGAINEHQTEGELTIHVLTGKLFVRTAENEYTLGPNELLLLDPGVTHDIKAVEATKLLMTFVQLRDED
jgi:quercetin dioxygenase-like cupin family protein